MRQDKLFLSSSRSCLSRGWYVHWCCRDQTLKKCANAEVAGRLSSLHLRSPALQMFFSHYEKRMLTETTLLTAVELIANVSDGELNFLQVPSLLFTVTRLQSSFSNEVSSFSGMLIPIYTLCPH